MRFEQIHTEKRRFLPLLLLADPSEAMVDLYLDVGALYTLLDGETCVCVAVVVEAAPDTCELKNLATAEAAQGRGYGSQMMEHLFATYGPRYSAMLVGTSEAGVSYYERFGFSYWRTRPAFFTNHYPEPIFEHGRQCIDMLVLRRPL